MKSNSKWSYEKDKLIDLIFNQHKSYEEVGRMYNCSGSNIKKVMKETFNLELPQRRVINPCETFNIGKLQGTCKNCGRPISKIKTYCCLKCESEYRHKLGYKKILEENASIMNGNYSPHAFKIDILKEQGYKCAICGMSTIWNGKPLVFVLDHIDGRASNNARNNLRCICPNCDSQLDTYKSKNKNSDRYYYRYGNRSAQKETSDVENPLNGES